MASVAVAFCIALPLQASGSASPVASPPPTTETVSSAVATSGARVAVAGDIACDPDAIILAGECRDAATANLITARNPAAVLALGDTQYVSGSLTDFTRAYDTTWGAFKSVTRPAVGNHEYLTAGAQGYHAYFGDRAGPSRGYYAFNVNGWRLYSLNTECARIDCAAEAAWMRSDVSAHPHTCQLMFMHRPLYSSGSHESSDARPFWAVGYDNSFELALAGHDHLYERFAPKNQNGAVVADGIRSFVVGTGGKSLYPVGTVAAGSQMRFTRNYGVLFLTLGAGSYAWNFRAISGASIDSGSASCR